MAKTRHRTFEIFDFLQEASDALASKSARVHTYAWLSCIGLPDLEAELNAQTPASFALIDDAEAVGRGLEHLLDMTKPELGAELRRFYGMAHHEFATDYRAQLVRVAGETQPLA